MKLMVGLVGAFVFWLPVTLFAATAQKDSEQLFYVEISLSEGSDKSNFNASLTRAMRVELVRLTGIPTILSDPESSVFTAKPKRWLTTFGYSPRVSDGVKVGENIYFIFSKERLSAQFHKMGWTIWPLEHRPYIKTIIRHSLGGNITRLTSYNVPGLPNLDIRILANKFGLNVQLPKRQRDWLLPSNELNIALLKETLIEDATSVDRNVLTINMVEEFDGQKTAVWAFYTQNLSLIKSGTLRGYVSSKSAFNAILGRVLQRSSLSYRQNADILGTFTLNINGVDDFASFITLERFLTELKPLLREVTLLRLGNSSAVFDIEYQGEIDAIIKKIALAPYLKITENNALIGQVDMEFNALD